MTELTKNLQATFGIIARNQVGTSEEVSVINLLMAILETETELSDLLRSYDINEGLLEDYCNDMSFGTFDTVLNFRPLTIKFIAGKIVTQRDIFDSILFTANKELVSLIGLKRLSTIKERLDY